MKTKRLSVTATLVSGIFLLSACSTGFTADDKIVFENDQDAKGTLSFDEQPHGIAVFAQENNQDGTWVGVGVDNSQGLHDFTISRVEFTDKDGNTWKCPELSSFVMDWKGAYDTSGGFTLGYVLSRNQADLKNRYEAGQKGTSFVLCDSKMPKEFKSGKIKGFNNSDMADISKGK